MEITPREKMIGSLSYILFFLPMLLDEKTEFTIFHARQSFGIFLIGLIASIIGVIPVLGTLVSALAWIAITITIIFLMIKAYLGEKFLIAPLSEFSTKAITKLTIEKFFMIH